MNNNNLQSPLEIRMNLPFPITIKTVNNYYTYNLPPLLEPSILFVFTV